MVKTLEYAAEKWERKTAAKGAKWKDRTIAGEGNYCANFGAFVGHPVTDVCNAFNSGVNAVTPADFEAAIRNKRQKYIEGLRSVT
jgi:hypothetical protein